MRRFVALAVICLSVVFASVTYGATERLYWEHYGPTVGVGNGTMVDTTYISGAVVGVLSVDTTTSFTFPAGQYPRMPWSGSDDNQHTGITLNLASAGTLVSTDSIFVAVDVSFNAGQWHEGTFQGRVVVAPGNAISFPFIVDPELDSGNQAILSGGGKFRFRVRADGNTAARMSALSAYLTWQIDPKLRLNVQQVKWEQYGPTAGEGNGTMVDTSFITSSTTTGRNDTTTTFTFPVHRQPLWYTSVESATMRGGLHLTASRQAVDGYVSSDSLFIAFDGRVASGDWAEGVHQGRLTNPAAGGHEFFPIITTLDDSDGSGMLLGGEAIRFRVRGDGNTAARMAGARLYMVWFSRDE